MTGGFHLPAAVGGKEAQMDDYPATRRPAGSITIEHEGADRRVLCLSGDVDTEVAARFTSSQGRARVAVDAIDAAAVTFIGPPGLALLLLCVEASFAAGRPPLLRAVSHPVDRALRMAGIDGVFPRTAPGTHPAPHAGSAAGGGDR